MSAYSQECNKRFKDWCHDIPVDLLKILLASLIIFFLGFTQAGNWLKCNFIDSTGCLAKINLKVKRNEIATPETFLNAPGIVTEKELPRDFSKFKCFAYKIRINNEANERPKKVMLKITPLASFKKFNARILGYKLSTGPETKKEVFFKRNSNSKVQSNEFSISAYHFEKDSSLLAWEYAACEVYIGYPAEHFKSYTGKLLLIEANCEGCQKEYITYLSGHKG